MAALLCACATSWSLGDPVADPAAAPAVPAHRAVVSAVLEFRGRHIPLLVHLSTSGPGGEVRAHFGTEGGITAVDLSVVGGATTVHAESALADLPGVREMLAADLRRLYGDRSLAGRGAPAGPARAVVHGDAGLVAIPLVDGTFLAFPPAASAEGTGTVAVTVLDAALRPEAVVAYGDRDADGVPRLLSLRDLRDGHALRLDVERVLPPAPPQATERGRRP